MSVLVDIACPECERTRTVRKVAIGRYRCEECDVAFSQADVLPE